MKRFTSPLLLALTFSFAACQQQDEIPLCCSKPATTAQAGIVPTASANTPLSDMSLYNLAADWTDQNGQTVKLQKLRGKVQLVAMIYTSCGYACPRLTADLQAIESRLQQDKRQDVHFTLVTMDPDRDTPEKLRDFAKAHQLDTSHWTLLTSQPDNIQELAALLNVKYAKDLNGNFSHSNLITVLNAQGEIVHQQEGLGTDPEATILAVKGLQQAL